MISKATSSKALKPKRKPYTQVNDTHKKSKFYKKPKGLRNDEGFTVRHYAGDVVYHAGTYAGGAEAVTWLDKNNYSLAADQERTLGASSLSILAELFQPAGAAPAPGGSGTKQLPQVRSASRAFMTNLEELISVLGTTSVQFVRCVKPCAEQQPGIATGKMILNQLRCNGTMEAVEVMQAAYPSRISYDLIHGNIVQYMPEFMQKMSPNGFFEVLMEALDIPKSAYQLGRTKLFMKAGTGKVTASPLIPPTSLNSYADPKTSPFNPKLRPSHHLFLRGRRSKNSPRWTSARWCLYSLQRFKNIISASGRRSLFLRGCAAGSCSKGSSARERQPPRYSGAGIASAPAGSSSVWSKWSLRSTANSKRRRRCEGRKRRSSPSRRRLSGLSRSGRPRSRQDSTRKLPRNLRPRMRSPQPSCVRSRQPRQSGYAASSRWNGSA